MRRGKGEKGISATRSWVEGRGSGRDEARGGEERGKRSMSQWKEGEVVEEEG